jgi:MinD-like ATPase involved in chromosome partitioning or flagellar assembly
MTAQPHSPTTQTRFIAFYSYKGGVGRTLALANCARVLTAIGKKVVLLDFDLEAPGLHHFDAFQPKNNKQKLAGFAEYLEACIQDGPPENLEEFIHECKGKQTDKGKSWLMPAGLHSEPGYLNFLNGTTWSDFYTHQEGYKILENLRGHIMARYEPDYVFIDARTGLSEIGGIATHQLADIVVLVFNLNGQNLDGAKRVFNSIRNALLHPDVILVASPVPVVPIDKGAPFDKKMQRIKKDFSGAHNYKNPLIIPYHPLLAFDDRLLVDDGDLFSSDTPYRKIVEMIQEVAEVDADYYLQLITEPMQRSDWIEVINIAEQALARNSININLQMNLAAAYYFTGMLEKAITAVDTLLLHFIDTSDPQKQQLIAQSIHNKGVLFGKLQKLDEELEAYDELLRRFGKSQELALQKQVAQTLFNKGVALRQLQRPEEAIAAYDELLRRFGKSQDLTLQETVGRTLVNKGAALGQLQRPEEEIAAYDELLRRFGESQELALQKQVASALVNKGFNKLLKAKRCHDDTVQWNSLLQEALAIFEYSTVQTNAETNSICLGNLGYTLFLLGRKTESEHILLEAMKLGGHAIYQSELEDSYLHPVTEDTEFRTLLERLWNIVISENSSLAEMTVIP